MTHPLFADSQTTAYQAGQMFGTWLVPVLLLLGILKCTSLLRRPQTSGPCATALLLTLSGWFFGAAFFALSTMSSEWAEACRVLSGVLNILCNLAAIVVAIVGLATYDARRHNQGRAQAVTSLILSCLLIVGGLLAALLFAQRVDSALENGERIAKAGERVRNEEFNFAITPAPGWFATKPTVLNESACNAFRRLRPEGYFIVIAEHPETITDLDDYMDIVKENLDGAATLVRDDSIRDMEIAGVRFKRRSCVVLTAEAKGIPMYFDQCVTARPGFAWQLTFWCQENLRHQLQGDFDQMIQSFRLLDDKLAVAPGKGVANRNRPEMGYRTALDTTQWQAWKPENITLADFAALRSMEAVVVVPVELPAEDATLDDLAHALLGRIQVAFPDDIWKEVPWQSAWGQGMEITGTRMLEKSSYDYVFRVVRQGRLAHLHAGWAHSKKGDLKIVRQAMDAIHLIKPEEAGKNLTLKQMADPKLFMPPGESMPEAANAEQRQQQALVINDIGIELYKRKEYKKAAVWFHEAMSRSPKDHAMLGNYADALSNDGRAKEALEFLTPRLKPFEKIPDLHLKRAHLLADTGDAAAGNEAFLAAIAAGLTDENEALEWLQTLNNSEQYEPALAAAEAWMKKSPDVNSRRWHAQTLSYTGETEKAVELLEKLGAEFPDDRRVTYDLAEMLNSADEHARAAVLAEKLLADGKETPRALMVLGWSQMGRKWYREAKATFERAAKKQPDEESVQNALRRASAMLGQGNNSDVKKPIEAVKMPEAVQKLVEGHQPPAGYGEDQSVVWLISAKGYHFDKKKPLRRTWHRKVRILTTQGANDFSSIEHSFHPLYERIFINQVSIHDENGKVTTPANITDDAYVMDLNDGNATHRKKLHFQVPGLRPGCVLEYQITIEDMSPAEFFPFERHQFSDSAADIVFITGDALDDVKAAELRLDGTTKRIQEKNLRAWIALDTPIDHPEPLSGLYEDRVPGVNLAGNEGSWEKLGADFLHDIQDQLKAEPQTSTLAKQLVEGAKSDIEKVARLARHVQKEISYTAIEFGTRARRPNPASQTLKQKYGDCKDQALLLHQLLTAVDVKCQLALVNTDWRVHPALPTLDQFNHMVVHVPCLGESRLVDTTNAHLQLEKWQADSLWHSHALLLDKEKTRLIPPEPRPVSGSCLVESQRTVTPSGEHSWEVRETLTAHGYYAAWLRGAFAGLDKPQILQKAQSLMDEHARIQLEEARFEALGDPSHPAVLELRYLLPDAIHADGSGLRAGIPAVWESDYLATTFVKDRRTPFEFRYPFQMRSRVVFDGMPGAFITALQSHAGSSKGAHASHEFRLDTSGTSPALEFEFRATPASLPAADYNRWHEEWSAALKGWTRQMVWKP